MGWISQNISTIIVSIILIGIIMLIIRNIRKGNGHSCCDNCGGECSGCQPVSLEEFKKKTE